MNYYTKKQKSEIKSGLILLAVAIPLIMFSYLVQLTLIN